MHLPAIHLIRERRSASNPRRGNTLQKQPMGFADQHRVQTKEQKIKLGVKQLQEDPFNFFKDKNVKDIITVKVHSTSSKGIIVKPEGSDIEVLIKKNQIEINA